MTFFTPFNLFPNFFLRFFNKKKSIPRQLEKLANLNFGVGPFKFELTRFDYKTESLPGYQNCYSLPHKITRLSCQIAENLHDSTKKVLQTHVTMSKK